MPAYDKERKKCDYGRDKYCFQRLYPVKKILVRPKKNLKRIETQNTKILDHQSLFYGHQVSLSHHYSRAKEKTAS